MENTFLPGTVRNRLEDLMRIRKVSQTELALKIGCGDSVLSRFLTGKSRKCLAMKILFALPGPLMCLLTFF